ncbi:sigma-E factor negative regulatory protein [Hydrogenophaga sp.]|nr:sigma-E factor negative regulatory protein [Hydrogenophaga sp.]
MSAFVDNELSPSEVDALLTDYADEADARANWQAYHLIGDVLRGSSGGAVSARPAPDFVAAVCERLRAEPVAQAQAPLLTSLPLVRGAAANDSVFRWKLVAAVASLAAVVAVSWTLIGGTVQPASAGSQLALTSGTPAQPQADAVVVQTAQGQVLRDVRLEELLAEHRQYGGMSALQMPAGFLRNATYDAAPQR